METDSSNPQTGNQVFKKGPSQNQPKDGEKNHHATRGSANTHP